MASNVINQWIISSSTVLEAKTLTINVISDSYSNPSNFWVNYFAANLTSHTSLVIIQPASMV